MRQYPGYDEIYVTSAASGGSQPVGVRPDERTIAVEELDEFMQPALQGIAALNPVQVCRRPFPLQ